MKTKSQRATITVEAALTLPVFVCSILTIAFIIQALNAQEIMQHVITNAANEMALDSYSFYATEKTFEETRMSGLRQNVYGRDVAVSTMARKLQDYSVYVNKGNIFELIGPTIAFYDSVYTSTNRTPNKGENGRLLFEEYLKKNLSYIDSDIDGLLKRLHIAGGYSGLDIESSTFLENGEDISIILKYDIKIPLPFQIVDKIPIRQGVKVRAWGKGD